MHLQLDAEDEELLAKMRSPLVAGGKSKLQFYIGMAKLASSMHQLMVNTISHPIVEQIKRDENFDLVVFGFMLNNYQIGLAAHFRCPAVVISNTPAVVLLRDLVGNPYGVSHVASPMLVLNGEPMSFRYRVMNYLVNHVVDVAMLALDRLLFAPVYELNFPADRYPSYAEAKLNVSLVMVSSHLSLGSPMPLMPGLLEVGGIQAKRVPDPLPDGVRQWMDDADDNGVIYFSLGTIANSVQMPAAKVQMFLRVFGRLKQRVLWKWEGDELTNRPANVMTASWLPQDDVLAHRKVRLFVSHCGMGGLNEAKYHGVPILGMPIFGDQLSNARMIAKEGWSVELNFAELNETALSVGLHEMLTNGSYREVVQRKAQLYKDRPQHPLDQAVWWVEYVLRHNGAKHMQSEAVFLNWWQYHSLDVIGLLLAVALVQMYVGKVLLGLVWRRLVRRKKVKNE